MPAIIPSIVAADETDCALAVRHKDILYGHNGKTVALPNSALDQLSKAFTMHKYWFNVVLATDSNMYITQIDNV